MILLYGIVVSMSYNKALFEYRMSKTCNASMFITAILLDIINDSAHSSCENNEAKVFLIFQVNCYILYCSYEYCDVYCTLLVAH